MNPHKSGFIENEVAIQKLNCSSTILEKYKQIAQCFCVCVIFFFHSEYACWLLQQNLRFI